MDTKEVLEYIKQNGIDYDKAFVGVDREGCIEEYTSLYNNVLDAIEQCVINGVNNSFNNDLKNTITKLTKLVVKISKEKNGKKINAYTTELAKLELEIGKQSKNTTVETNIRDKVNVYIDTYIKGTQTLVDLNMSGNRKEILEASITKLNELKNVLSKVYDVSTETAAKYATEIVTMLKVWANQTAILMHNEKSLAMLDDTIKVAQGWQDSREVIKNKGIFNKGNKAVDTTALDFVRDDMYMISKSPEVYEDVKAFSDNLKEYQQDVSTGRFGTEELEKEIDDKQNELVSLNNEKKDLVAKFKNKELTEHQVVSECKGIDSDMRDIENDIADIRKDIERNKASLRVYNRVFRKLEKINKVVMSYKHEPVMMSYLGGMIDFARISRVMHGNGTEEDINHVVDINTTNIDINNHTRECYDKLITAINSAEENEMENVSLDDHITQKNAEELKRQKEADDEYLKNLLQETEDTTTADEHRAGIDQIV